MGYKMALPTARRTVVAAPRRPTVELRAVRVIVEADPDADDSYLEHEGLEERRTAHRRGVFEFIRVRAEAEVTIEEIPQTLTSAGLGGIESDSEDEYTDEIVSREWRGLRNVLKAVGVSTDQLPIDVDPEWVEWRT